MNPLKKKIKGTLIGQFLLKIRELHEKRKELIQHRAMLKFYRVFMFTQDGLFFDVGANVGNRSAVFLELGARVIAIEPQLGCVNVLMSKYQNHPKFTLVQKALGSAFGELKMFQSSASTIASMSPAWIQAVKQSGRFEGHEWSREIIVPVVTLDSLVQEYGEPDFIKIDVEGFELEVLRGLKKPVKAISFEFTPEYISSSVEAVAQLEAITERRYQVSVGESMRFLFPDWINAPALIEYLKSTVGDRKLFGDIYAITV